LYGTLFHANYLTRALTLYGSLERHAKGEFELVMLCMDDIATRICEQLSLRNARVVSVRELEQHDKTLVGVKPTRTMAEYCWTCVPSLLMYLLEEVTGVETAIYLDADLMFFSNPKPIFDEWGDADIAIHEHRSAPRYRSRETWAGKFNVGWVGIRNGAQGRKCLARWRDQCIEVCTVDSERGLCGDQKYLDEWPRLYDQLVVLQHKGVGLAPWNVECYKLTSVDGVPNVDGVPLIFHHFHRLHILYNDILGHVGIIPSSGHRFSLQQKRLLYAPYVSALRAAEQAVAQVPAGAELPHDGCSLSALAHMMLRDDILLAGASGRSYQLGPLIAARDTLRLLRRRLINLSAAM
jgi:hypothetical protein